MRLNSRFWWRWLLSTGVIGLSLNSIPVFAEDAGNLYNTAVDVRMGERFFERTCSRCHGFDAKGNDEAGGTDLTGRLTRATTNLGVYNILREGIPGTAMVAVATGWPESEVWQVVAYIDSLSTDPANVDLPGSASAGRDLFAGSGDCDSCHMVSGAGGRHGPDLSRVGERRDPEELMSDLINPHVDVAPRWWTMKVTDLDGVVREGLRMNEDSFSLRIMDSEANLWSFPKNQIESYERVELSTMPSYAQTMNESELDDLVAYLFSLRKEI